MTREHRQLHRSNQTKRGARKGKRNLL